MVAQALLPLAELPLQSVLVAHAIAELLALVADFVEDAQRPSDIEPVLLFCQQCLDILQVRPGFWILHAILG